MTRVRMASERPSWNENGSITGGTVTDSIRVCFVSVIDSIRFLRDCQAAHEV